MNDIRCPHCGTTPEDTIPADKVTDWYYNQNLFAPEEEIEVECPRCLEKFWVKTFQMIGYECAKKREDL